VLEHVEQTDCRQASGWQSQVMKCSAEDFGPHVCDLSGPFRQRLDRQDINTEAPESLGHRARPGTHVPDRRDGCLAKQLSDHVGSGVEPEPFATVA
jgi:hypothetical protein